MVIGGGDTGSDCVGTSNRHGAKSVTQFELMPMPPDLDDNPVLAVLAVKLRTSCSHEEGCERDWAVATKRFRGEDGAVEALVAVRVEWEKDPASGQMRMVEVPGSEFELPADLVLLAMGFVIAGRRTCSTVRRGEGCARQRKRDDRRCGLLCDLGAKVFAAGDMRRGQSLVVWAIREGRQCARAVDEYLMGSSELPR